MINISDVTTASLQPTLMAVRDQSQALLHNYTQSRSSHKTPVKLNNIETWTNECPFILLAAAISPPSLRLPESQHLDVPQQKSIIGRILGEGSLECTPRLRP